MARVLPASRRALRDKFCRGMVNADRSCRLLPAGRTLRHDRSCLQPHRPRVRESEDHVLINPYGMLYEEITASSLIKIEEGRTGYGLPGYGLPGYGLLEWPTLPSKLDRLDPSYANRPLRSKAIPTYPRLRGSSVKAPRTRPIGVLAECDGSPPGSSAATSGYAGHGDCAALCATPHDEANATSATHRPSWPACCLCGDGQGAPVAAYIRGQEVQ
jgi:hypothetical protein